MRIKEIIKHKDIETYRKLRSMCKSSNKKHKNKKIKLGDKPENLMRHDAYKRVNRRLRQIKWE